MKTLLSVLSVMLLIAGCTSDYKVKIESNTSWSGSFGGTTIDGSNNQTIDIPDEDIVCVVVQKQTQNGFLTVKMVDEGNNIFAPEDVDQKTTTAAYGVVTVCNK